MTPPPLRTRIRNGSLLMLALTLTIGAFAVPTIHKLGGSIRETLYRNYVSIDAGQHVHAALYAAELAQLQGSLTAVLPQSRDTFTHWIDIELNDITEVGEEPLARDIQGRGQRIFDELSRGQPGTPDHHEFNLLHQRVDDLIEMNQAAMFHADSRTTRMSDRLAYEFAIGLMILLVLGAALSWTLAWNIAKPLAELSEHLRSFSLHGPSLRLGKQPLAELQAVASEFNRMAERLEQFEKLNVDRLIYEKSKTEAILESIEDGIVLIDSGGVVTHINEVASIILGVEREEALGSPFDDLNSNHPHYLRVRSALQSVATQPLEAQRVEVDLHVRGRDHTYVLKPVPLRQENGQSFGTILILQDITYLRDKDRARTNLVATLSHELKTPLTSLALSAELLERSIGLNAQQGEMVGAIREDVGRMRDLANELLDLARGEGAAAIALQTVPVDVTDLLKAVTRTFVLQAEQKPVQLQTDFDESAPKLRADPVKLSWVVSNLVANALRYTPAGGTISVSSRIAAKAIKLQVCDTGPGIAPQLREHLFERFAQWNVNGAEPGSAGLGLAIAKEIVEAHGGRIFVDSTLGQGTCFTVELPTEPEALWQNS
ncbi:MAG: ATP-binding protein [Candidatus Binataceae bacterium]|jgi:NtrC-family two-component system sensor histidine kinase KinB